ncbi:hypothetical protein AVEN_152461-1 [Araneus ventricosus]|uniref:Uncharacterized protein n=1 Tax=Araneus ventricosus TaxID=182803 RepID=A0A4Y2MPA5_ARAVE|nr:hypothetical protein AVEN_152461-1 [Araneus ventricosus]
MSSRCWWIKTSPPPSAASFEGESTLLHLAPQFRYRHQAGQSVHLVRRGVKSRERRFLATNRGRINAKRKKSWDASGALLNTPPLLRHRHASNSDLIGQELERTRGVQAALPSFKNSPSCGKPTGCRKNKFSPHA